MNIYSYKHIIFAIREEYLKIQEQLLELRKYLEFSNKIKDSRFNLVINRDCAKILLEYEFKLSLLDKVMKRYGIYNARILDLTDGIEEQLYKSDKKKVFYCSNKNIFNQKIYSIINSDFVNEMKKSKKYVFRILDKGEKYLEFSFEDGLYFIDAKNPYYSHIHYNIKNDKIFVNNNKPVLQEEVLTILNYQVDVSKMDNYYQNIFKGYTDKEMIIDNYSNGCEDTLSIYETPRSYILSNKKK